jgi:hypothetical protein
MPEEVRRHHAYHAEAHVLQGHLRLPLVQEIKIQAYARLAEEGGYIAQHESNYRLESVISFRSAYTQVAGNPGLKPGHGWTTLATSVVEGLNILDVVTADRVVAQVSLDHPLEGYVPHVTFLGTRFENLKIAGHPVNLDLDPNLLGSKPENDAPYTGSSAFLDKVARQHEQVQKHPNLLEELLQRYTGFSRDAENPEAVECSLVNQAEGAFPGRCHGHVIHVPDFGTICLANVRLEQSDYKPGVGIPRKTLVHLTMMDVKMGCVAEGGTGVGVIKTNGTTMP